MSLNSFCVVDRRRARLRARRSISLAATIVVLGTVACGDQGDGFGPHEAMPTDSVASALVSAETVTNECFESAESLSYYGSSDAAELCAPCTGGLVLMRLTANSTVGPSHCESKIDADADARCRANNKPGNCQGDCDDDNENCENTGNGGVIHTRRMDRQSWTCIANAAFCACSCR